MDFEKPNISCNEVENNFYGHLMSGAGPICTGIFLPPSESLNIKIFELFYLDVGCYKMILNGYLSATLLMEGELGSIPDLCY